LVVDVPTAYNVILGRPTLHKVKAVIAPSLLQPQFEADDGSVGEMHGDQPLQEKNSFTKGKTVVNDFKPCH